MNKKQQAAIWVGVAFVICAAIYVPYEGIFVRRGDNLRAYMGYRFFFDQPSKIEVFRAIWNKDLVRGEWGLDPLANCNAQIVPERIWVVIGAIGLVTLAGIASLGDKKNKTA